MVLFFIHLHRLFIKRTEVPVCLFHLFSLLPPYFSSQVSGSYIPLCDLPTVPLRTTSIDLFHFNFLDELKKKKNYDLKIYLKWTVRYNVFKVLPRRMMSRILVPEISIWRTQTRFQWLWYYDLFNESKRPRVLGVDILPYYFHRWLSSHDF